MDSPSAQMFEHVPSLEAITKELQSSDKRLGVRFRCLHKNRNPRFLRCHVSAEHFILERTGMMTKTWDALGQKMVSEEGFVSIIRSKFCGYHDTSERFKKYIGFFKKMWRDSDVKTRDCFRVAIEEGLRDVWEYYYEETGVTPEEVEEELNRLVEEGKDATSQPSFREGSPNDSQLVLCRPRQHSVFTVIVERLGISHEEPLQPPEDDSELFQASDADTFDALHRTATSPSRSETHSSEWETDDGDNEVVMTKTTPPCSSERVNIMGNKVENAPGSEVSIFGAGTPTTLAEPMTLANIFKGDTARYFPPTSVGTWENHGTTIGSTATPSKPPSNPNNRELPSPQTLPHAHLERDLEAFEACFASRSSPPTRPKYDEIEVNTFGSVPIRNKIRGVKTEDRPSEKEQGLFGPSPSVLTSGQPLSSGIFGSGGEAGNSLFSTKVNKLPPTNQTGEIPGSRETLRIPSPQSTPSKTPQSGSLFAPRRTPSDTKPLLRDPHQFPQPPIEPDTISPGSSPEQEPPMATPSRLVQPTVLKPNYASPSPKATPPRRTPQKEQREYDIEPSSTIVNNIRGILRQPIDEGNKGYIYVLKAPRFFEAFPSAKDRGEQWVKIGISRDINKRIKSLKAQCGFEDLVNCGGDFGDAMPMEYLRRIERVCHAELHNFRRPMNCGESANGLSRCEVVHKEWFNVSEDVAIQVIRRWMRFLAQDPYTDVGLLNEFWGKKIRVAIGNAYDAFKQCRGGGANGDTVPPGKIKRKLIDVSR
ncbi:hypothetical protein CC80DRAFT_591556 [Byssothecium circinans]|uniref:Bacteriophage T5 Orf172 DNA-binding domain-containing protein n=1 Tax=Byssothecium circinans TaxID=147558 RepID=A0A6A5U0E4_9PLEO|nr:hypothetical protein CC80DRAFT_591556 [Byssothecium circinans]